MTSLNVEEGEGHQLTQYIVNLFVVLINKEAFLVDYRLKLSEVFFGFVYISYFNISNWTSIRKWQTLAPQGFSEQGKDAVETRGYSLGSDTKTIFSKTWKFE